MPPRDRGPLLAPVTLSLGPATLKFRYEDYLARASRAGARGEKLREKIDETMKRLCRTPPNDDPSSQQSCENRKLQFELQDQLRDMALSYREQGYAAGLAKFYNTLYLAAMRERGLTP